MQTQSKAHYTGSINYAPRHSAASLTFPASPRFLSFIYKMTRSIIHPFIHFLLFTDWGINAPPSGSNSRPLMSCPWQDHGKKVYNLKLSTAFATRCLHWRWLSWSEPSLRRRDLSFTAEDPRTDRSLSFFPPKQITARYTKCSHHLTPAIQRQTGDSFSLSLALSAGLLDPASLDVQLLSRKAVEWEREPRRG